MTTSQRTRFEATMDDRCSTLNNDSSVVNLGSREWLRNYPSHNPISWGGSNWAWLPGLRSHQGRLAVAARFVFDWRDGQSEKSYYDALTQKDPMVDLNSFSWNSIDAAMVLGSQSEHSIFTAGAWNN